MGKNWLQDFYLPARDQVALMTELQRIAFAAACATRALVRVNQWTDDWRRHVCHEAIAMLWEFLVDHDVTALRTAESQVRAAIPDLDEEVVTFGADRAVFAILYALQCAIRNGDEERALKCISEAYGAWSSEETLRAGSPVTGDVMDARERDSAVLQREISFQDGALRIAMQNPEPRREHFLQSLRG